MGIMKPVLTLGSSMRHLLLLAVPALLVMGAATHLSAQPMPTISSIIQSEGVFAVSDGSSVFQLHKDGTFVLEPVGISGRTVRGVWTQTSEGQFTVVGKWEWVNGLSRDDDYRRMRLHISWHGEAGKVPPRGSVKVHPAYLLIEELVTIDEATWKKAGKAR